MLPLRTIKPVSTARASSSSSTHYWRPSPHSFPLSPLRDQPHPRIRCLQHLNSSSQGSYGLSGGTSEDSHNRRRFSGVPASSVSSSAGGSSKESKNVVGMSMLAQWKKNCNELGSNVPWGIGKVAEVMMLWLLVFTVFRASIWRVGMFVLDVASEDCIPLYVQAALTLGLDTSMLMGTVLILKRSLAQFRPLREKGLFPLQFKGNWWATVLLSCLCIPAIDWLGAKMLVWFPQPLDGLQSSIEVHLQKGCTIPNVLYFTVLTICAPLWEEIMFRGFLLPSLGKYLPSALAIFASSSIFAVLHSSPRQFPPLFCLGVVIANAFASSKNLVPSIMLHSLYNGYVFWHMVTCV